MLHRGAATASLHPEPAPQPLRGGTEATPRIPWKRGKPRLERQEDCVASGERLREAVTRPEGRGLRDGACRVSPGAGAAARRAAPWPSMEVLRRSSVFAAEVMEVFDRSPTDKELVSQAKALCRDYINSRLVRAGVSWSKPEYNAPVPGGKLAEVSSILLRLGDELEYIRPNVYRNVARQLNISLHSETVVTDAFLAVAAQIFTAGITWGKVVSLYAVAAGLAVDCVRHAQPAMVHTIVDCLGEFVRKTLVTWLKRRGGWADITKCVVNTDPSLRSHWLVAAICSFGHFLKTIFFVLLPER